MAEAQVDLREFSDALEQSQGSESQRGTTVEDTRLKGIGYLRVSTDRQAEEGDSLEAQEAAIKEMAEQNDIELVEIYSDEGESGGSFTREGLEKAVQMVQEREINYFIVYELDRIGRDMPRTTQLVRRLAEETGVVFLTPRYELDPTTPGDYLILLAETQVAEVGRLANHRHMVNVLKNNFEQRNWATRSQRVPFGYVKDGEGWIEVDPETADVVPEIFEYFLDTGLGSPYAETATFVNRRYSEFLDEEFESRDVRLVVSDSVYVGLPSMSFDNNYIAIDEACVECPELQLIEKEVFEAVQDHITDVRERHSDKEEHVLDVAAIVEILDGAQALNVVEYLKMHCPGCDGVMVKNGQRTLSGYEIKVQNYKCRECGRQTRIKKNTVEVVYGGLE